MDIHPNVLILVIVYILDHDSESCFRYGWESAIEIKKVYDIVIEAGTFMVSNIKTAEAVKVVENSQRYKYRIHE